MMADDSTGAGSGGVPTIQEINNFRQQAQEMPLRGLEPEITAAERLLHERDAEIRAIIASADGRGKPWACVPSQQYISRAPRSRRQGEVSEAHRRLYTWIEENETEPEKIRKWRVEPVTADAAFWARQPDLKCYLLDIMLHNDNARPEVPHAVRHLHAACMVMGAHMVIRDPENLNAWVYQAMYPLLCLQQRARGGRPGSIFDIRQMAKSMIDYLRGEHIWDLLVDRVACRDNAEAEQVDKERVRVEFGTTEEKAAEALKRTAERLADVGKLQQAGVQLGTNGKFASRVCTPKIEEIIAKKWRTNERQPLLPPVDARVERAWLRANKVEPYQLEGGAAVKQLFKSAKGKTLDRTAGPGFGGALFSHLYDALSVDTFEDRVLDSVSGQINLFLAGRVPAAIMPLLCGGRGGITMAASAVGENVRDGEQEHKRLFSAPSTWYRMASTMAQRLVLGEEMNAEAIVCSHQMVLGISNAVETAKGLSDISFAEQAKTKNFAELHIDAVAMYNMMRRAAVMLAVRKYAPRLGYFVATMLEGPFLVTMCNQSRVFSLHEGFVIGDPLAGMLASMNVKDLLVITPRR
jgi:hypothetical protein